MEDANCERWSWLRAIIIDVEWQEAATPPSERCPANAGPEPTSLQVTIWVGELHFWLGRGASFELPRARRRAALTFDWQPNENWARNRGEPIWSGFGFAWTWEAG